ncbi:MAG: 50S ribosomal protein L25/general stress protein Ctc, partial [Clostridiales bacterium]
DKTRDLASNAITHISFQALKADQKVNSHAHVVLHNTDTVAGTLEKMVFEIPYAAFPEDMIDTIVIDLAGLPLGSVVTVGDIPAFKNGKAELQIDADTIVCRINDKKDFPAPLVQPESKAE